MIALRHASHNMVPSYQESIIRVSGKSARTVDQTTTKTTTMVA
jgi:hypothetical protein